MDNPRRMYAISCALVGVFACLSAGFIGLISSGFAGGTAMGVAPEATFKWVEPIVCPDGAEIEFSTIRRSYHAPGESEPQVVCVSPDGTRQDALGSAILAVLGVVFAGTWLIAFFAIAIPLGLAAVLIVRWTQMRRIDPASR